MIGVAYFFSFFFSRSKSEISLGKKGKDSAAAQYALATPTDGFSIQDDKPYAEVPWLATPPVRQRSN
jgi:hypothetical protein